jgi:hypothetical protein
MRSVLRAVLLAAALAACKGPPPPPQPMGRPVRDMELLTAEEIRASHQVNMYTVISSLRPGWLRTRAAAGGGHQPTGAERAVPGALNAEEVETVVYVDMTRMGGRAELRDIGASGVDSARFVPGFQAVRRWGYDHREGAILIYHGG